MGIRKLFVISILATLSILLLVGCASKNHSTPDELEVTQAVYSACSAAEIELETTVEPTETTEATEESTPITFNSSGKMYIKENDTLSKDAAEELLVRVLKEYYTSIEPVSIEPDSYLVDFDASVHNERIKEHLAEYLSKSDSTVYYKSMSEYGTYYSVSGLTEKEYVLFEMDNNHFAISEPYSDITDYSMRYPYLFTIRNSDSTSAYYWCAQQDTALISYASHRVIRIWIYNSEWNTYSCIYEKG